MKKETENNSSTTIYSAGDILHHYKELFPSIYLTMLSIIQGVSLSFLLYNIFSYYFGIHNPPVVFRNNLNFGILGLISLIGIAFIWYEYIVSLPIPRSTTYKDTLYPIFLGVTQVAGSFNLSKIRVWLICYCAVLIIGILAYRNTRLMVNELLTVSDDVKEDRTKNLKTKGRKMIYMLIFLFVIFLKRCFFETFWGDFEIYILVIVVIAFFLHTAKQNDRYYDDLIKKSNEEVLSSP